MFLVIVLMLTAVTARHTQEYKQCKVEKFKPAGCKVVYGDLIKYDKHK